MRALRTPRGSRITAAWSLWLLRLSSRFALGGTSVPIVVLSALGVGAGLSAVAVHVYGSAAALAVRSMPGYFDPSVDGLTNATHFVFACAVPLLVGAALGLSQVFGVGSPDAAVARRDRSVWQGLGLSCGDVVLTHHVLPRVPVLAAAWAPVAALLTVEALSPAEHRLAVTLLAGAVAVEVLRLGTAARRLSGPLERLSRTAAAAARGVSGATLVGAAVGVAADALRPFWDAGSGEPLAVWLSALVVRHPVPVWIACALAAGAGVGLLVRAVTDDGAFHRLAETSRPDARPLPGWPTRAIWLTRARP